jgi:hypothetical protein
VKVIYVAHPLGTGANRDHNRLRAMRWCAWVAEKFDAAISADWIVLSGVWPESLRYRNMGIIRDLEMVSRSDEVFLVGGRVSPGMEDEATRALNADIPVYDMTSLGVEPPALDITVEMKRWSP